MADLPIHAQLIAAVGAHRGTVGADRLCRACVDLLDVDAAAISLIFDGINSGTLGVSSAQARVYDEVQFTLGEGPCLDSVSSGAPVLVSDLGDHGELRWSGYAPSMLAHQIRGVYALPVVLAGEYLGALDLFRHRPGPLSPRQLVGALGAAELCELLLLDLLAQDLQADIGDSDSDLWTELNHLTRVEVSQATGMLIVQLDVEPAEALVRLRAHAYATNQSATQVARRILDHDLRLVIDR